MAIFGPQDSGSLTAADAARKRELAKQLMGSGFKAKNALGVLASALEGAASGSYDKEASSAEAMGQKTVADLLQNKDYTGAMSSEWASPQQAALASALQGRDWSSQDRQAQWAREDQRAAQQAALQREQMAQPDWQTLNAGGDVFRWNAKDPNSRPELFFDGPTATPDLPTSVQEFQFSQQNPEFGTFLQNKSGPLVNVNTGENSGPFQKKIDESAATRYDQMLSEGQNAQAFTSDLMSLNDLAKGFTTGKEAEVMKMVGPYAQALGIDVQGLGPAQAYDAIIARMAPQMRQPGAGASSDFDARQFLKSLPGLGNTPQGNSMIIQTFQNIQNSKVKAAEIANRVARGEISWQEGDKLISQLGNPFQAFKDMSKSTSGAGSTLQNSTSTGIQWSIE